MADPKLKLGNDIWATKQKSLLAYNDEGGNFKSIPFQVDRISGGTYVGRNGLIQYAASNEPRVDFTSNTKGGLLLEQQRTNSLTYYDDFTNSVWSKQGTSSVLGNTTIAPDGTLSADTLSGATGTSVSGSVLRRNVSGTVDATLSIYVKSLGSTSFSIYIRNGSSGQVQSQDITPNNTWQRVTITHDPDNGQIFFGNTDGDVAIWGAQLEAGTYSTSIIPTSGSAVTRVVDTCESGENLSNLINNSEGTLFIDFEFFEQGTTSLYQVPIALFNSGGSGSQNVRIDNYSGKLRIYIVSSSGTRSLWDSSNSISNVVANQRYKVAIRYKNGDCASYVNGELYKSDSGGVSGFNLVKMVFGYANFGNTLMHRGKINDTKLYDSGLTNAKLATITTI